MEIILGQLANLELKSKWPNESHDFTPWLALPENITKLGEAVGIELEVENTEVAVGPYSADILAKDTGTDTYVVIENQFGKTNHDHLGKLITYASVLEASAVIWIAEEFTEEHKKALNWLNDHTTEEISYYGVKVELWQIDTSNPAVRFNLICQPSQIVRQTIITKSNESISDVKRLQLDLWSNLRESLIATKKLPSTRFPRPQYWYDIPIGKSGIHISCTANTSENLLGVRIYIRNWIAEAALSHLLNEKDIIEKELGFQLEWNPHPEKRDKIIVINKPADLNNKQKWQEYIEWMTAVVIKFREVFGKRVKNIEVIRDEIEDQNA